MVAVSRKGHLTSLQNPNFHCTVYFCTLYIDAYEKLPEVIRVTREPGKLIKGYRTSPTIYFCMDQQLHLFQLIIIYNTSAPSPFARVVR